jgi:hypothetical protein
MSTIPTAEPNPLDLRKNEPSRKIEEVSYTDFWDRFNWLQGQHITLVGTTGCGKTTLELELMGEREYVIFLGTKEQDETQDELGPLGFRIANDPSDICLDVSHRWVLHPGGPRKRETAPEERMRHREYYREALTCVYHQTAWAVVIDEGRYICDYLGLKDEVQRLYSQGRSQYNSVVMGTQRPAWVPLEAFDQASHLFFFKDNDLKNINRIAELAGLDRRAVQQAVPDLESTEEEGGQFLYYNTRTDDMLISKVEL